MPNASCRKSISKIGKYGSSFYFWLEKAKTSIAQIICFDPSRRRAKQVVFGKTADEGALTENRLGHLWMTLFICKKSERSGPHPDMQHSKKPKADRDFDSKKNHEESDNAGKIIEIVCKRIEKCGKCLKMRVIEKSMLLICLSICNESRKFLHFKMGSCRKN